MLTRSQYKKFKVMEYTLLQGKDINYIKERIELLTTQMDEIETDHVYAYSVLSAKRDVCRGELQVRLTLAQIKES